MKLNTDCLVIDTGFEVRRIVSFIQDSVVRIFKKKGAVIAISGGVDSCTTAALCVRALGKENVLALFMPERDSGPSTLKYARMIVEHLGVEQITIDIGPILEVMGCYRWRDEAIREVFPEYDEGYRNKIALGGGQQHGPRINYYELVIQSPSGVQKKKRLPWKQFLQIVAATNMKQRTRKSLEYFHADRLNFAVVGTPNYLEFNLGFFVKQGDGSADLKPIAHLYKAQVYAIADYLGLPSALRKQKPTTDTYSLEQSQEEFYFQLPIAKLDLILYALNQGLPPDQIAEQVQLSLEEIQWIVKDINQKRQTADGLHLPPLTLGLHTSIRQEGALHT